MKSKLTLQTWDSLLINLRRLRDYLFGNDGKNKVGTTGEEIRTIEVGFVSSQNKKKNNKIKTSKYSVLNFIPKNLMEQFRRIANFYFLIVTIIALLIDSPVSPLTSVIPLVFVVTVTAVKQGYEDWLRHRADNAVNNEIVEVIISDTIQEMRCRTVVPGRLVKVKCGNDVPADLVLICCSDPKGKCHVTTANLDGETNLKTLRVPTPLIGFTLDKIPKGMRLEVPEPTADLYTFFGRLDLPGSPSIPLSMESIMLRGSRLQNTEWAIGCAVYTGEETKLALNSRFTSNKFTSCEYAINAFLIFFILVMIVEILISFFMKRYFEASRMNDTFYLGPVDSNNSLASILQDAFSFLLLYYYIIPISLYVTIEMYKFIGSFFIGWDKDLRCPETGQPAVANTSDLSEELGQVEILFSDKTGTLTKNLMVFKMCSINGIIYEERNGILFDASGFDEPEDCFKTDIKFFFTALAICHSVQLYEDVRRMSLKFSADDEKALSKLKLKKSKTKISTIYETNPGDQQSKYQASSPDEKALVEAAERAKVVFMGENGNEMKIRVNGEYEYYERLQVLEFTSERKRMSVVVKGRDGKIKIFCKGAESSVLPLCVDSPLIETTNSHINSFAGKGLRTLAIAYREIPDEEYVSLTKEFTNLRSKVGSEQGLKELSQHYRALEKDLILLGATAVEDRLQDEVAETLSSLRRAGIKIWVLTGDKVETAINVAQSCAHIPDSDKKMFLIQIANEESLKLQLDECKRFTSDLTNRTLSLVVDGTSMGVLLGSQYEDDFVEIAMKSAAVLCCRLSPLQKAQIVRLIKLSKWKPITAAIGDGANDISMIQEAHVGFGIFGREGRQAARSADFAFTKFCMLKKLLIVSGHWYYQRLAALVQYFFYKNLVFVNIMFFFQFQSLFSTQSIFDSMFLTTYNLCFTSVPCLVASVTEQSRPAKILLQEPVWYKKNRKNRLLSWKNFLGWCLLAIYHSVIIYIFSWLTIKNPVINMDGKESDLWCFGAALFHHLVVVMNLKEWLQTRYQTVPLIASVIFSILFFMASHALYTSFYFNLDGDVLGTYQRLLSSLRFWLASILVIFAALLPDLLIRLIRDEWRRRTHHLVVEKETENTAFNTSL